MARTTALPLYRGSCAEPAHWPFRGRDDAVAELLQQARSAPRSGDLAGAAAQIAVARELTRATWTCRTPRPAWPRSAARGARSRGTDGEA